MVKEQHPYEPIHHVLSARQRRVLNWGIEAELAEDLISPENIVQQARSIGPKPFIKSKSGTVNIEDIPMIITQYDSPPVPLQSNTYTFARLSAVVRTSRDPRSQGKLDHPARANRAVFGSTMDVFMDTGKGIELQYRLHLSGAPAVFDCNGADPRQLYAKDDSRILSDIQTALMDMSAVYNSES